VAVAVVVIVEVQELLEMVVVLLVEILLQRPVMELPILVVVQEEYTASE
tara:strand:- start:41 stop:187 length:147 start_codon:yes stop_codon:yes gene_type:complete